MLENSNLEKYWENLIWLDIGNILQVYIFCRSKILFEGPNWPSLSTGQQIHLIGGGCTPMHLLSGHPTQACIIWIKHRAQKTLHFRKQIRFWSHIPCDWIRTWFWDQFLRKIVLSECIACRPPQLTSYLISLFSPDFPPNINLPGFPPKIKFSPLKFNPNVPAAYLSSFSSPRNGNFHSILLNFTFLGQM